MYPKTTPDLILVMKCTRLPSVYGAEWSQISGWMDREWDFCCYSFIDYTLTYKGYQSSACG